MVHSGLVPAADLRIRPRRATDLPVLEKLLLAQQADSHYPLRNPLPIPVEEFLHARDAVRAWVAEVGGEVVGNVCRLGPLAGSDDANELNAAGARAHGCEPDELAWVTTLFTGAGARGLGVGRRLLETAVDDARRHDLRPCLEVLPVHPAAVALYRSSGWRPVHRLRPTWLREARGDDGPDVEVMVLTDEALAAPPAGGRPPPH